MNRLKKLIASLDFLTFSKGNIFIFVYHDISEINAPCHSNYYSTTKQTLLNHIIFFKKHFEFISINDLENVNKLSEKKNYVTICFDDGFYSVKDIALPIFIKENIPFSLFINADAVDKNKVLINSIICNQKNIPFLKHIYNNYIINKDDLSIELFIANPVKSFLKYADNNLSFSNEDFLEINNETKTYLNREDIQELKKAGVFIGNHTKSHKNLNHCNLSTLEEEILVNKKILYDLLDKKTNAFAIPFGKKEHYNSDVLNYLTNNHFDYIFTTNPNKIKLAELKQKKLIIIPRIGLTDESVGELKFLINRTFFKTYDL
jgi:peptidoglycan/xylan/chitin deacetylase (PgdA/CDA1 family)